MLLIRRSFYQLNILIYISLLAIHELTVQAGVFLMMLGHRFSNERLMKLRNWENEGLFVLEEEMILHSRCIKNIYTKYKIYRDT